MITKEEILSLGWLEKNNTIYKKGYILRLLKDNIIEIIRKTGNYPTVFKDKIKDINEFIIINNKLKI